MEKIKAPDKSEAFINKEWIGVEPTNDGFADQSLTAWVPLRVRSIYQIYGWLVNTCIRDIESNRSNLKGHDMENLETYLKKLNEENWRNITNSVVYIRSPEKLEILKTAGFDVDSRNDGFIAMCFVDHIEGLSFYVIAAAHIRDQNIFISKENKSSSLIFRIQGLSECFYLNQEYINVDFLRWDSYAKEIISSYEADCEEAVEMRDITELDDFRNPFFPDDIEVLLLGKSFGQKRVYVRAQRYGENCLYGCLLDEPPVETGLHKGDEIDFMLIEREGKYSTVHVCR